MNNFGTVIPDLVFENLTEDIIELVQDELQRVFDSDPRIRTLRLQVQPLYDSNALYVVADVLYVELNVRELIDFNIVFNEG